MKAILSWLATLVVALSIGTAISLLIVVSMLWWKGAFGDERLLAMLAALQGIKPLPAAKGKDGLDQNAEQPSLDQIMQTRLRAALDLDLRENAIDKSLGDLRTLELQLRTESKR